MKKTLRIATLNANGLRASLKKGLDAWIKKCNPDIVCLQEVRARPEDLGTWQDGPDGWHAYWLGASKPGYSGVAILCKEKPDKVENLNRAPLFKDEGRWLCLSFKNISVASLYLPSGTSGDARQLIKYQCMKLLYARMKTFGKSKQQFVIAGDYNIAHTKLDIKNWQSNQKNSGFLADERKWMDDVFNKLGWVDVFRSLDSSADRYSWWSQRAGARGNNVGWRIDYQIATPKLAACAKKAWIETDPILSDHAPVVIDYKIS